jgi:hypothetical protein
MAGGTLADVKGALTDYFSPKITKQINRTARMLQLFPILPADKGQGQAITWGIKTSGATAAAVADGGAVPAAAFDKRVKASLVYGDYQFQVSETGQALAAAQASLTPEDLIDLFEGDIMDSSDAMASQINKDFWVQASTGGGVLPITAYPSAVAATGTYATINKAVDTLFQGNVFANGGTPRDLTLDLIRTGRRAVRTNGGAVDLWVCDLVTFDRYGGLIDPQRRYVDEIRTAAGLVRLDAGYKALEFEGAAFLADKDAPAGTLAGFSTRRCEWRYLPDADVADRQAAIAQGSEEDPASLPIALLPLARTGDAENMMGKVYPQFVVRRPNQCVIISDLQ